MDDEIKAKLESLKEDLQLLVTNSISSLVSDVSDKVEEYAPDIGNALMKAIQEGDLALRDELLHQLEAVAELSRLRADAEQRELVKKATAEIIEVAISVMKMAVKKFV